VYAIYIYLHEFYSIFQPTYHLCKFAHVMMSNEINENVMLHFIIDILPISTKRTITFHFYILNFKIWENNDIRCWKFTSWFGTGTHIYQFSRTNKHKSIPIAHRYMATYLPGLVHELQGNKNIDIKFSTHDAFLEFLFRVRS
jgi:hypothetical protein